MRYFESTTIHNLIFPYTPKKNNYTSTPTLATSTKQKDVIKCKIIYSIASSKYQVKGRR